jgi:hypothetical protein
MFVVAFAALVKAACAQGASAKRMWNQEAVCF